LLLTSTTANDRDRLQARWLHVPQPPLAKGAAAMQNQTREGEKRNARPDQVDQSQQHPIGPTSVQGVEASDLPDKGRGDVDTNIGKVLGRKLPGQTGGEIGGDVGMRAMPDSADSKDHGYRKNN
jgi:hypothetical protein